jgi:hypothetical protein
MAMCGRLEKIGAGAMPDRKVNLFVEIATTIFGAVSLSRYLLKGGGQVLAVLVSLPTVSSSMAREVVFARSLGLMKG